VLGELDSSRVTLAVVFGIPVALGLVVALGFRRGTPAVALLAGSLVVVGIAVLATWAILQPGGQEASGSTASPPAGGSVSAPVNFSCTPSGTQLQETARGIAFSETCLAAPAGQLITIEFDNQDAGTAHNIHIFSADPRTDPNARSLFTGDLVTGPDRATYEVPAQPAGRYFFHCDVHPAQMVGGFVVAEV
jgi:plastocyanin